jgi:hypothetical protein
MFGDKAAPSLPVNIDTSIEPLKCDEPDAASAADGISNQISRRMSSIVTGVVGGILAVTSPVQKPARASMADIEREMAEARRRAQEEAAKIEEEEERKAAEQANEREMLAIKMKADRERKRASRQSATEVLAMSVATHGDDSDLSPNTTLEAALSALQDLEETAQRMSDMTTSQ